MSETDKFYEKLAFDLKEILHKNNVHGYALQLFNSSTELYSLFHGVTDLDTTRKVDDQTMFCLQSTTKSLTAFSLLLAEHQGLLSLEDKIIDHLPDFYLQSTNDLYKSITIRHLLSHTSGLPREGRLGGVFNNDPTSWKGHIESVYGAWMGPLGTFNYSNIGMDLAVFILETVIGMKYEAFVAKNIAKPLGITILFGIQEIYNHDNVANGYFWNYKASHPDGLAKGCGGAFLNLNDMTILGQVFLRQGEVDGKQLFPRVLFQQMRHIEGRSGYGLGTMVGFFDGIQIPHHSGGGFGYGSEFFWLPDHNIGLVAFTNQEDAVFTLRPKLIELIQYHLPTVEDNTSEEATNNIDCYTGYFRSTLGDRTIIRHNNQLAIDYGDEKVTLSQTGTNIFVTPGGTVLSYRKIGSTIVLGQQSAGFGLIEYHKSSDLVEANNVESFDEFVGIYCHNLYGSDQLYVAVTPDHGVLVLYGQTKVPLLPTLDQNRFLTPFGESVLFDNDNMILPENTKARKCPDIVDELLLLHDEQLNHRHLEEWMIGLLKTKLEIVGKHEDADKLKEVIEN